MYPSHKTHTKQETFKTLWRYFFLCVKTLPAIILLRSLSSRCRQQVVAGEKGSENYLVACGWMGGGCAVKMCLYGNSGCRGMVLQKCSAWNAVLCRGVTRLLCVATMGHPLAPQKFVLNKGFQRLHILKKKKWELHHKVRVVNIYP